MTLVTGRLSGGYRAAANRATGRRGQPGNRATGPNEQVRWQPGAVRQDIRPDVQLDVQPDVLLDVWPDGRLDVQLDIWLNSSQISGRMCPARYPARSQAASQPH